MMSILKQLSENTLHQFNSSIYSYNLAGKPELFVNKASLKLLGTLNKVYNTDISEIVKRIIHQDDLHFAYNGIQFVVKNPDMFYLHYRRYLVEHNQHVWTAIFTGASKLDKCGNTKRIFSMGYQVSPDQPFPEQFINEIQQVGFEFSEENLRKQFGKKSQPSSTALHQFLRKSKTN